MSDLTKRLRKHPVICMDKQNITSDAADRIDVLEAALFKAYCEGYEQGHDHTVDGYYDSPAFNPGVWPEIKEMILEVSND